MVFILYNSSRLRDIIATIRLGYFVKITYADKHLKSARTRITKFPKDQIKPDIEIIEYIKNNRK